MRTTTDPNNWKFSFTITHLALFLGKSPVTIRGWERKGLISLPRDSGGDRKLSAKDIRCVALKAFELNRITRYRLRLIEAAIFLIEQVEKANDR